MKHLYLYTRVATYSGYGGPATATNTDPAHPATPTRAGRFTIGSIQPHTTLQTGKNARMWSAVAWGTPLRLGPGQVIEIRLPGNGWQRLTSVPAWRHLDANQPRVLDDIKTRQLLLWSPVLKAYAQAPQNAPIRLYREIPDKWIFNDFGHTTVKYYRDANQNHRQDHTEAERTLSDFIHTVPNQEMLYWLNQQADAGLRMPLTESHGCVHVLPAEIDEMVQGGFLSIGGTFVVHSYTEQSKGSFREASAELRTNTREVHFFPKEKQISVYMVTKLS